MIILTVDNSFSVDRYLLRVIIWALQSVSLCLCLHVFKVIYKTCVLHISAFALAMTSETSTDSSGSKQRNNEQQFNWLMRNREDKNCALIFGELYIIQLTYFRSILSCTLQHKSMAKHTCDWADFSSNICYFCSYQLKD